MALYCDPLYRDVGLRAYHADYRGVGGLLADPLSTSSRRGEPPSYLPQYNLQAIWRRRIAPEPIGLVLPLLTPRASESGLNRPPGHLRFDQEPGSMKNRNLLAVKKETHDDVFRLFVVAERGNRKRLESVLLNLSSKGNLTADIGSVMSFDSNVPLAELREARSVDGFDVFARSRSRLELFSINGGNFETIFNGSIRSFEEHPHMSGELTICDQAGMIWNGPAGSTLARTKNRNADEIIAITHSQHPRVLFAATETSVRILDLRADNMTTTVKLFEVPPLSSKRGNDEAWLDTVDWTPPTIVHLRAMRHREHTYLVTTTNSMLLCDERLPGRRLLEAHHNIPDGGQVMLTAEPVIDEVNDEGTGGSGGAVHSAYVLDHACHGVSVLHLYEHASSAWSSVRPIRPMPTADQYRQLVRPLRAGANKRLNLYEPTRGMAIVQHLKTPEKKGHASKRYELLLSSLDDGSVWYQQMRYGDTGASAERRIWERSRDEMDLYMDQHEEDDLCDYLRSLPQTSRSSREAGIALFDVEIDEDVTAIEAQPRYEPARRRQDGRRERLEPLEPAHPDALLSGIMNTAFKKFAVPTLEAEKRRRQAEEASDDDD